MYEPKGRELVVVRSRLSDAAWEVRVRGAREAEKAMQQIAEKLESGKSFNEAVRETLPSSKRSWAVRRWPRWKREGFEGLFDLRKPPGPRMTLACQDMVTGARLANPKLTVDEALVVLKTGGMKSLPSVSTIKRLYQNADARRRYWDKQAVEADDVAASAAVEPSAEEEPEVEGLEMAGGEFLKAADLEIGAIGALTDTVEGLAKEVKAGSARQERTGDGSLRDGGKFTASYNRARKRAEGEEIASYLRPAPDKGRRKVAADFSFIAQSRRSVSGKLAGLVYEPTVNPSQGWDGLRSVYGERLESLAGYAYMPSTLQKLSSELAQLSAGGRLLRTVGMHWHQVATERWGEDGTLVALYVDNHAKEVWSKLFTMAGKVSHRSRVMPCITTTYVQTGAGTPVVVLSQSGSAPLAPRLCELVEEAERRLGEDVRRAVVIDAEGSTYDILESFAQQQRVFVTPCKPATFRELELRYSPGSYYRPYRERDELRVATATLRHKSTKREQEIGVLLVRREHRESPIALLTTGLALGFKGRALADLYFERWPLQENFFKDGAYVGLDRHRGNCARMVTNVAVATELEHLEVRLVATEEKLGRLNEQTGQLEHKVSEVRDAQQRASIDLAVERQVFDRLVAEGETGTAAFAKAATRHHAAMVQAEKTEPLLQDAQKALGKHLDQRQDTIESIEKMSRRAEELEPMRKIRQLDVSLDTVLTAMKLTLTMLLVYVLREYLPSERMSTATILDRVLTLRGRRETTSTRERVVFYENPRDPRINAALAEACEILNNRALVRNDRALSFTVEEQPP